MNKLYTIAIHFLLCAFSFTSYAQYTKLLDFAGTTNGSKPYYTSLFSDGTFLYGMTSSGGAANNGVIFKVKTDGSSFTKLLDFGVGLNGALPDGSLVSDGTFLYGMTSLSGANNMGLVFKIKTDGTGYSDILDFAGSTNGKYPYGSLFFDGTFLYGMTNSGGTNNFGVIFKIKTDGSSYTKLFDFADTANGFNPDGSLISDGTFLYGMTLNGGANNLGVVFKIKTDGSSYTKLLDFAGATNGSNPLTSLLSDGTFLYGMTKFGGASNNGVIFKIKPDGTSYSKLFDFAGAATGSVPDGTLISDGTFLYGMTTGGGANTEGVIFKIKKDGTGYSVLIDFAGVANGEWPAGSLISDGTYLYGMTWKGGTNNLGVLFKLQQYGTGISKTNNYARQFSVYPNPAKDIIYINDLQCLVNYRLLNITGTNLKVGSVEPGKNSIGLCNLVPGLYWLQLFDNDNGPYNVIINKE